MRQTRTHRPRRTSGLVLALSCSLGCGGKAADEQPNAPPALPPPYSTPAPPDPPRPAPTPGATPGQGAMSPTRPPVGNSEEDLANAQVRNILVAYCGACHGPPLTRDEALGGIWFIDDLEELVERGYIVPLRSADSRIIQVMRDGSMPPGASGLEAVTESDIQVVARFIDRPAFWPGATPPAPAIDAGAAPPPADAGPDGG
jgi:mono/diheme cytochrome c family protein